MILTISIMYIKKVNKNNSNISLLQGYLFFNVFPPEFPRLIVLKLIQTCKNLSPDPTLIYWTRINLYVCVSWCFEKDWFNKWRSRWPKLSRDSWKTTVESRSRTDLITQHASTMFLVPRRAPINMHIYCDFWNQSKFALLVTV